MNIGVIVWCVVIAAVLAVAYLATRMASREKGGDHEDMGFLILEFGRAFPMEAIREVQKTADKQSIFVRLHDNKTGLMRSMKRHFSCHVFEPGRVRILPSVSDHSLTIEFLDVPHYNGTYEFRTPAEAAEVSLWFLGNYLTDGDVAEAVGSQTAG